MYVWIITIQANVPFINNYVDRSLHAMLCHMKWLTQYTPSIPYPYYGRHSGIGSEMPSNLHNQCNLRTTVYTNSTNIIMAYQMTFLIR